MNKARLAAGLQKHHTNWNCRTVQLFLADFQKSIAKIEL